MMKAWSLPEKIMLLRESPHLSKMLYTEEDFLNNFEYYFIKRIASLSNVVCWHEILSRQPGSCMKGFIPHYPDFIVKLERGKMLLIETKCDHLANPASTAKVKQGEYSQRLDKPGQYKYFMTYQHQGIKGAVAVN